MRRHAVFRKCGWVVGAASLFWFGTSSRAAEQLDSPAKVAEWIRSEVADGEMANLEATVDGRELVAPEFRRISSLDQFVPLVDLKASDEWTPDPLHRFAWHYLVVHKIAGAILIPIALAALGGIVK